MAGTACSACSIQKVLGVIVVHGVLVRRPGVAHLTIGGGDRPTHQFEKEAPNSAMAFAPQRRDRLGLMPVSNDDPAWSAPHTAAHPRNPIEGALRR